jgi:SAM-dependent methyltransferase
MHVTPTPSSRPAQQAAVAIEFNHSAEAVELHPTRCAICGTEGNATELYPANLASTAFNPAVFSARRLPDRVHYRMVKCDTCGLVRSDPVVAPEVMARLYAQSSFSYDDELTNLRHTYGRYLAKLGGYDVRKGALLEIGCGNGYFLEEALAQGYEVVRGVEPSVAAVAKAVPEVRPNVLCDVMRPGLFLPEQFDVICMFQVFDHIADPGTLLGECLNVLRPGGLTLCINHDVDAMSARLLRERSPIVDIEHTYLYSKATIARLFERHGFDVLRAGAAVNNYSLYYLVRLAPFPPPLKRRVLAWLRGSRVGRLRLAVPLGNLYLIAQKPSESGR